MAFESLQLLPFPQRAVPDEDPVVITGVGIASCLGSSRESIWQQIQCGKSGVRRTVPEDGFGQLNKPCGIIDWLPSDSHTLKSIQLTGHASTEALSDAGIPWEDIDRERFACSISAQFGDISFLYPQANPQWFNQLMPSTASALIGNLFDLRGPRLCHTTACASGLVSTLCGARMIQAGQADFALCGAADAITELIYASFNRMGVLADSGDPATACKPFDRDRNGFVLGEGAAMMVLERRSHAMARNAKIYAEIASHQTLCQAHHVTGLDGDANALKELVERLVSRAGWDYLGPQYINAHGTGTEQNDRCELQAIRSALGDKADEVMVSSNKAVLGHLVNAAGSIELAITALAMRDGYVPPTMHLKAPESIGNIDCMPCCGAGSEIDRALKLSLAFGGHLVGIALRRCPFEIHQRQPQALHQQALLRSHQPAQRIRLAA